VEITVSLTRNLLFVAGSAVADITRLFRVEGDHDIERSKFR
jgi:hypothetical protein